MPRLAKILLPVDFSARSPGAAYYALTLARRFKSEITMLHVVQPFSAVYGAEMGDPGLGGWLENRKADATKNLGSFLAGELGKLAVNRVVVEGDPAIEIVELAHQGNFDLVVLPTHGYGPFRRFILGSVTAKVLHDADCPVFTGAHIADVSASNAILFRNILCAVDLGPQSEKTLSWAARFAEEFEARLKLVHALPQLGGGQARYFDPAWHLALERQAREQMEALIKKVDARADLVVESGAVQQVVKDAASAGKADLVVIGRHADSGILGRLRAHAYAIVRESPSPVVSI